MLNQKMRIGLEQQENMHHILVDYDNIKIEEVTMLEKLIGSKLIHSASIYERDRSAEHKIM